MASQASESQRWSCGTLQDGFDVMDLAIQEQKILREIQDMDDELNLESGSEGPKKVADGGSISSMDTIPATPEELNGAGIPIGLSSKADGSELACTEPQSVGGTGKVIATPVRNDNASKPEVDDTLVNDPKDEQSTKPSGEGPAVPANADPPKPDSQQKADEKEKEDDNKEVGADGEPNVSQAMQEMNRKVKLRNAARSRLNRWVKPHKKQPALDAPEWLVKEWKTGNKNDISQLLSHCNFNKDVFMNKLLICVKKKQKIELTKEEGWYSETELVELGWSKTKIDGAKEKCKRLGVSHYRQNEYDSQEEFWVTVKETGKKIESTSYSEIQTQEREASGEPTYAFGDDKFAMLDDHKTRGDKAATAAREQPQQQSKGGQSREALKKFMESLIGKTGKLRSLIRELETKYDDTAATSCINSLRTQVQKVDECYDKCQSVWTKGEVEGFNTDVFHTEAEATIKSSTYVCSAATGVEMKIRNAKKFYTKRQAGEKDEPQGKKPKPSKEPKDTAAKAKSSGKAKTAKQ